MRWRIVSVAVERVNSSSGSCVPVDSCVSNEKARLPGLSIKCGARLPGLYSHKDLVYLRNTEAFIGKPLDMAEWKYSRLFMVVPPCGGGTARTCLKQPS